MSPRRAERSPGVLVELDPSAELPLFRQLYQGIRIAALEGRLLPGGRLPATRTLAGQLGISRNTVILAFDQLVAEGYVAGRPRSGYRIAGSFSRSPAEGRAARPRAARGSARPRPSARGTAIAEAPLPGISPPVLRPRPFRPGVPALEVFPRRLWARLTQRRWRSDLELSYADPAGFPPLRAAVAEYLGAARGARCIPDQVVVVSGSQQGVDLTARVLLDPGDSVWMEEPGYSGARTAFLAAGARLAPVPVDSDGLDVAAGGRIAPVARMAYVSPSHQFPLGVTMSAARRLALIRWAEDSGAWILEDDYDSEFRYASRPLACLQGMDDGDRVIYLGTFSKTLFPALRLGYLVVPLDLVEAFRAARAASDRHSPTVDQAVLADFLTEGHFARHVRRMRALYQERQEALLQAVRRHLGGRLDTAPGAAGLHLMGWLPAGVDDRLVAARALELGIEAPPVSRYATGLLPRGGLLLGYAGYTPEQIEQGTQRLAGALSP